MNKRILFLLSFTLIFLGCTDKDNGINITQSNLHPLSGEIDSISTNFSFKDELAVNGENYKLFVSNTPELESQAILSFAYLPDNVEYISDASLTLYSDLKPAGEMEFKLKILEQDYLEKSATWDEASEGVVWDQELIFDSVVEPLTFADTIATKVDSLVFNLSNEEIKTWTENDLTLFSIIVYTDSENYIEIFSSEHSKKPVLKFNYKLNSDASAEEVRVYNRNSFKDTSIIRDKEETDLTWGNCLKIYNLPPVRSFLKFEVDPTKLLNQELEELSDFQLNHLTVNNAYLRLYVKNYSFFEGSRLVYITPYRVTREFTEPTVITPDDLEYLVNTGPSVSTIKAEADSVQFVDVKITPILQGIISGKKENYGLVLKSSYQSTNFDKVEFWGNDAEDITKRPKVKFVYTLPLE